MEYINTTIPFTDEQLDKYFDDIEAYYFLIDLDNSEYRGKQLLTYIYNSGMNASIVSDKFSDRLEEILVEYITTTKIVNIQSLNDIWIDILLYLNEHKNFENNDYNKFIKNFITKHDNLVKELNAVLRSLKYFLITSIILDENEEISSTTQFLSVKHNIVSLRNGIDFWRYLDIIEPDENNVYKEFIDNSFDGKKIAYFFFMEFNPFGIIYMSKNISKEDAEKLSGELIQ